MTRPGQPRVAVVLGTASGGTARHAGMLAEGCRQAGLAILALGPLGARAAFDAGASAWSAAEASPVSGRLGDPAIPFHPADISDRLRPGHDLAVLARLRRLLRRAAPDVVHAHGVRAGAFSALALLSTPGRRRPALVVSVHNAPPRGRAAGAIFGALELICARRADAVLCASADLADRMRRRVAEPLPADNSKKRPQPADAEPTDNSKKRRRPQVIEFDVPALPAPVPSAEAVVRARHELGSDQHPVVLAAGRLAAQKGFDTLLAAAAAWRGRDPLPRVAIAGTGPLAGELAEAARRSGADLVLLGDRDDIPALLAAADVVTVPSRWEARALIVQEALRAGVPIVATRAGGTPDLTGPDAAILVSPGDSGALSAAILAVLDDPALAARLSAAALARAVQLPTPADAVTAAIAIYRQLAAPGAEGPGGSN